MDVPLIMYMDMWPLYMSAGMTGLVLISSDGCLCVCVSVSLPLLRFLLREISFITYMGVRSFDVPPGWFDMIDSPPMGVCPCYGCRYGMLTCKLYGHVPFQGLVLMVRVIAQVVVGNYHLVFIWMSALLAFLLG